MTLFELVILAVGLSMDAFAIAICKGLSVPKVKPRHYLSAGLWFGGAQAVMPLIGYFLGSSFRSAIENIDHWICFGLLLLIGLNMIRESREQVKKMDESFGPKAMFPLAIADSIDALASGITFSFLDVKIIPAVLLIGVITFFFSIFGLRIGNRFGAKYKAKAEVAGGIILILIGTSVLFDHLGLWQALGW